MKTKKLVLLGVILSILVGCSSTKTIFKKEVKGLIEQTKKQQSKVEVITEKDLVGMPEIVQRYFRYVGVIGREKVEFVKLKQTGEMKTSPKSNWKKMTAEQYYLVSDPKFYWRGAFKIAPLFEVSARDKYENGKGNMLIKIGSLIKIADAKDEITDISSYIRYFNEMIWFPTSMITDKIKWKSIDDLTVEAVFSTHGLSTKAILKFNEKGECIEFISNERYASTPEGIVLAPWIVRMRKYKEFDGFMVPTEGEAIYDLKEGEYEYIRLVIEDVVYDDYKMY